MNEHAGSGMNDRDALRAEFEERTGGSGEELP